MSTNANHECPADGYPACLVSLSRIEAKLDTLGKAQADVEIRVRSLEVDRAVVKGGLRATHLILVALGGIAGAAITWVITFVHH